MVEFAERVGEVNALSRRGSRHQASLDTLFRVVAAACVSG